MTNRPVKRIPYAIADYRRMREEDAYYVDKTHFIPLLEESPFYLFCIRPRRIGKSLWLSTLQHYYDVNLADDFASLFADTYIGAHPTDDHNGYLTMFFNFSLVNPDMRYVHESFEDNGRFVIETFVERYERFFLEHERQDILSSTSVEGQLRRIFYYAGKNNLKTFLLIDEYDNFANTILVTEGEEAYHDLTHGGGFFRYFFNLLKGATGGQISGLTRMFITGVSPLTMDDVTSGFNIGTNISLDERFSEMIGFTQDEVVTMLSYYRNAAKLPFSVNESLALMQEWYDNYRFGPHVQSSVFNSDMVLYFILTTTGQQRMPDSLIDQNVRIDYTKLRHLVTIDQKLNGNFSQLRAIIETGETVSQINISFPVKQLRARENFISLLYYFGLLTFAGEREGEPLLQIPNRTIKDLMYGYIRDGYQDGEVFDLNLWRLSGFVRGMAHRGEWEAVFDFLAAEVQKQASVRDYIDGEKMIHGFLLAYLNVTNFFLTWSEREMNGGFVDLYLEPFLARYPDAKFGYLIELKYIARGKFTKKLLQEQITEAETQLAKYATDARLQKIAQQVTLKKLVLVYKGWELVYREEWSETEM